MARVEFVYFDAGGGHRAAATALRTATEQQLQWEVHLMNLQELLDSIDPVLKLSGVRLQDLYNWLLKMGWTWGTGIGLRVLQAAIRLYHPSQVRLLKEYWRQSQPAWSFLSFHISTGPSSKACGGRRLSRRLSQC